MVQHCQAADQRFGGDSATALEMRSHDWSQTSLGSIEAWPLNLKTTLNILFHTPSPMFLAWGSDRLLFYNDACVSLLGQGNCPCSLKQPITADPQEMWPLVSSRVEQVFSSGQSVQQNQPHPNPWLDAEVPIYTWFYSPLWDSHGQISGVFATGIRVIVPREGCALHAVGDVVDLQRVEAALLESEDVTAECKQTEADLRKSEDRFRLVTQAVNGLIFDWNVQTNEVYRSAKLYAMVGVHPEAAPPGASWWHDRIHPDDQAHLQPQIIQLLASSDHLYESEYRVRHEDGHWVDVWEQAYLIRDEQGKVTRIVGCTVDISDRKRAELEREQLLVREQQYVNQLQGLTSAALAINSALSVEDVLQVITDQAAATIGAHQSVISMTLNQDWAQSISAVCLSDKYVPWQDYNEKPDGSGIYACVCHMNRPMRMTQAELEAHPHWRSFGDAIAHHPPMRGWLAAPLVGRDGENIGLIQLSDKFEGEFTEADQAILVQLAQMASVAIENARLYEAETQARAAAEKAREEAQAANRLKDEFLAVLSHELRSPLNPILGWSRLLQTNQFDERSTQQALQTIERNAKLQTQLIEDLLDVSRILQGKVALNTYPVDLAAVVESALDTVRLAAESKAIALECGFSKAGSGGTPQPLGTKIQPSPFSVLGDAVRLQQVVWNLLSNAVKFTPEGGRVTVTLEMVMDQDPESLSQHPPSLRSAAPYPRFVQLTVADTGKGIRAEFLPHVFDYFRQEDGTTTRKFGGLGLGLAIVRYLTELHGGTVQVESAGEGQGAVFTVRFPLLHRAAELTKAIAPSALNDCSQLRILVVDDEVDMRELMRVILEQQNMQVQLAASAVEALVLFDKQQPDIVISDIGMPEMDGYELMQKIRQRSPEEGGLVPALALTPYAGEYDQQQALSAGFQQHLSKPIEPEDMVRAIAALIKRH